MTNPSLVSDEIYVRNMAALFRVDSRLAQRIDECVDDGTIQVEPSRSGPPTVSVRQGESERCLYLHSRVNPVDEAERLAEAAEIGDDLCYIISGFGLGHHVKAIHKRLKGDAFLIVCEPSLPLLKAAMETVDCSELFHRDRCIIFTECDKGLVQTRLEPHTATLMLGTHFVAHPPSERFNPDFHAAMRKIMTEHIAYCKMCVVTLVANAKITCQNIAYNFPAFLTTPPIDILRERFKGRPAVIVSAGPSLQRNIGQLQQMADRAVIIAVQTTFKMLLDRGIRPHFVTSLDYHEMSKRFFEKIDDFGRAHLVAEPKVTWHVIDAYKGPISILGNGFATGCLGEQLAARDALKSGATVSHLALYLAVYLGCEPIILIGQDLGYTNNVYYTPGVAMHEMWRPELNRFWTMETREWERIVRARNILRKCKDVNGRDIYTDEQLFTYLQQFEGDFSHMPGRVIDATEGGVRKSGAQIMTLAEAAQRYCREPLPQNLFSYLDEANWHDVSRLGAGREQISRRLDETRSMEELCEKLVKLLHELMAMLDENRISEFNRRLAEVDALRVKVRSQERIYKLISSASQHAELQRFSADRKLKQEDITGVPKARRQLERDIRFISAVVEGARTLREILEHSLERIEAAMTEGSA